MIYSFYLYYRQECIYYSDFQRTLKPKNLQAEQKLISGLLFSMRAFAQKIAPAKTETIDSFTTRYYKLHLLQTPTGYKLVLVTDPGVMDQLELLRFVYSDIFVPTCLSDPCFEIGSTINNASFTSQLNACLQSTSVYAAAAAPISTLVTSGGF
eukprot:Filipodium_phascolosomae@DN2362_c0_g1_i2.p2